MKGIFEDENLEKAVDGLGLSNEIIAVQPNDWLVPALEKVIQDVIDDGAKANLKNAKGYVNKNKFKAHMKKIEKILYDRFGYKFHIISGEGVGFAIMPMPPIDYNVLNRDAEDMYRELKDAMGAPQQTDEYGNPINLSLPKEEDAKDIEKTMTYERDWKDTLVNIVVGMEKINDKMNMSGIDINLGKARIDGLPKDYVVTMIADFYTMINICEATARELVAVMLHEVGHSFTHVEYSYRTANNTSVLLESVHDNYIKKGMSIKDTLRLAYTEMDGAEKVDDKNILAITMLIIDEYGDAYKSVSETNYSITDSEQLADQFAGRFGVGAELGTGLNKLFKVFGKMYITQLIMMNGIVFLFLLIHGLLSGFTLSGALSAAAFAVIMGYITMYLINTVITLFIGGASGTYDNDYDRIKRIRNELVRQLRIMKLDKSSIKQILSQIADLDTFIDGTSKLNTFETKLGVAIRSLLKISSGAIREKEAEKLMERMMENELHVSSNKLKTLA